MQAGLRPTTARTDIVDNMMRAQAVPCAVADDGVLGELDDLQPDPCLFLGCLDSQQGAYRLSDPALLADNPALVLGSNFQLEQQAIFAVFGGDAHLLGIRDDGFYDVLN